MSDRSHSPPPHVTTPELDAQAAEWLVAREGEGWTPVQEEAWRQWCDTSDAHRAAYAHAERIWSELTALRTAPELLDPLAGPAAHGPAGRGRPRRTKPGRRGRGLMAGLAAAVVAAVLIGWTDDRARVALLADHRTGIGELREVTLPDGSQVQLGADSAIAVHYSATERRLELLQGEALFEALPVQPQAAGGETRPFVVVSAQGHTRALGTRFVVEHFADHTLVTGVEHEVAVALGTRLAPGSAGAQERQAIVAPGRAVRYDASRLGEVATASVDQAEAWRRNVLVFDHASLADVVARLGRYQGGRILVWGDALRSRQVSGVFPVGDIQGSLQTIVDELDATALSLPGLTVLY